MLHFSLLRCRPSRSLKRCPCWTSGPTTATCTTWWTVADWCWTPPSPRTPMTLFAPSAPRPTVISTRRESLYVTLIFLCLCYLSFDMNRALSGRDDLSAWPKWDWYHLNMNIAKSKCLCWENLIGHYVIRPSPPSLKNKRINWTYIIIPCTLYI